MSTHELQAAIMRNLTSLRDAHSSHGRISGSSRQFYDARDKCNEFFGMLDRGEIDDDMVAVYSIDLVNEIMTTCDMCRIANGMVFPEYMRIIGVTAPPFHPNCGCETIELLVAFEEMRQQNYKWLKAVFDENNESSNLFVSAEQLEEFGFTLLEDTVEKLNQVLVEYGITEPASIRLFLATVGHESGKGKTRLELLNMDGSVYGHGYTPNDRGAGYIQLTHREDHLRFLRSVGDDFDGENTAQYIADNYPWEAAAWWWAVKSADRKTGKGLSMNEYAEEYGDSLGVFLITQYYVTGADMSMPNSIWAGIRDDSIDWRYDGSFLYVDSENNLLPWNWEDRVLNYEAAMRVF